MTDFWSFWVIAIIVLNLGGCAWLIWWTALPIKDEPAVNESMGHSFDGIEELNNPMPRWWLFLFWATLVFAVVYFVLYPGFGKFPGVWGWTSHQQWAAEVAVVEEKTRPLYEKFAAIPVEELAGNAEAMDMGKRLFLNNCAVCHGSQGHGARGFPNLADNDWLYGGAPGAIGQSIAQGRVAMMPPWGAVLGDEGVNEVAHYVASLSRPQVAADRPALVVAGQEKYVANCVACHGMEGSGNVLFGAPNLTDNVWLYGGDIATIKETLNYGRQGRMPAHESILSPEKIHVLTAYVYGLSATR